MTRNLTLAIMLMFGFLSLGVVTDSIVSGGLINEAVAGPGGK